jgi:hypothetical protein
MKHWEQLSSLDEELIKTENVNSLVSHIILGASADGIDMEDVAFSIDTMLSDRYAKLRSAFDKVWSVVRDEPDTTDLQSSYDSLKFEYEDLLVCYRSLLLEKNKEDDYELIEKVNKRKQ